MKPLLSYYGGKQRIASRIVEIIWQIPHKVYAEPFAGGLAVLFAKGRPDCSNHDHYREAINDKDELLINFYRVAREQPEDLRAWIEATLYSQAEYYRAKKWLKEPEKHTALELAWAYFVATNQAFSNVIGRGWAAGVYGRNHAYSWKNEKVKIPDQLKRLEDVYIGCEDALDFIRRWDSSQTLFYCDPPYPSADQGHYDGYTLEDWTKLCELLDSCQGSYILSNYDQPIAPKSAQEKIAIPAVCSAFNVKNGSPRQPRTEILWICNRSPEKSSHCRQLELIPDGSLLPSPCLEPDPRP